MIDTRTTNITIILSVFCDYHYHHRYHYSYNNFIITILCYAPSVVTCTVGGAIQMTVYITLRYLVPMQRSAFVSFADLVFHVVRAYLDSRVSMSHKRV